MKHLFTALFIWLVATPVLACKTALILAIDVSSSIDIGEYRYQVDGLADALQTPQIINVLVQDQIALAVVQWSGHNEHSLAIPFRRMRTIDDVNGFREQVRIMPREWEASKTAIGDAIDFAVEQFSVVPDCQRHVIDVSGDGASNAGAETSDARRRAQERGVEINGLAIETVGNAITAFYNRFVRTRGGFVITSSGFSDYPRAIHAKLLRELIKPSS